jgi:hypothetical protein
MRRTVAATDIEQFTEISGDRNPLHYDLLAAQASRFGEIVVGHSGSAPVSCEGHPSGDRENLTARLARAHSVMTPADRRLSASVSTHVVNDERWNSIRVGAV